MKYYLDIDSNVYADPSNLAGLTEITSPVRADGTLLPQHDNLNLLATDTDGKYFKYYLTTPDADGIYQTDTVKIDSQLVLDNEATAKFEREVALGKLVVTANTIAYDANGKAIGNMSAVVAIANFEFNKALSLGATASDAYLTVYKSTVTWKGNDNLPHTVQIESICEALRTSMNGVASILGV